MLNPELERNSGASVLAAANGCRCRKLCVTPPPRLSKRSASQARHVTRRLARIWETATGHLAAHAGPLDLAEISSSAALTRSQNAGLKSQPLFSAAERGKRRLVRSRSVFLVCAFCQNFETRTLLVMQLVAFSEDVRPTATKRPDFHHRGVMASSFFIF